MNELFSEECKLLAWGDTDKEGSYIQIGLPWLIHGMIAEILAEKKSLHIGLVVMDAAITVYSEEGLIYKSGGEFSPWIKIRVGGLDYFKGLEGEMFDIGAKIIE